MMKPTTTLLVLFTMTSLLAGDVAAQDLVITAVGDVALTTKAFKPQIDRLNHGIFNKTKKTLKKGDLVFLNLETPLTDGPATIEKKYAYTMPPERLDWLLEAGFNLFSLANNHSADAGQRGLNDTLDLLEEKKKKQKKLWWSGTVRNPRDAYKPTIIKRRGTKIAFLAVGNNADPHVNRMHRKRVVKALKEARKKADVVLLSVHYGKEYQHVPKKMTVDIYHEFAEAGADIILGHHPHVVRGIEKYKGTLIVHSLGNFAFSSKTIRHRKTGAKLYGMIATIHIEKKRVHRLVITPLYVNNLEPWTIGKEKLPAANFVPAPVKGPFAKAVLDSIQQWSDAIKGNKIKIVRKGNKGIVRMR